MTTQSKQKPDAARNSRSSARLLATQALYQFEMGRADQITLESVIREFLKHRLGREIDGTLYRQADKDHFREVVQGAGDRENQIDKLIESALAKNWSLKRLDRVLISILRAGVYELIACPDIPTAVIIDEYLNVGHSFFDAKETAFLNGVLDRLAKEIRNQAR